MLRLEFSDGLNGKGVLFFQIIEMPEAVVVAKVLQRLLIIYIYRSKARFILKRAFQYSKIFDWLYFLLFYNFWCKKEAALVLGWGWVVLRRRSLTHLFHLVGSGGRRRGASIFFAS
jgi:hypothetical protein